MPAKISRSAYADMFGPTVGDRVRLTDTDLIIEVERPEGVRLPAGRNGGALTPLLTYLKCKTTIAGKELGHAG